MANRTLRREYKLSELGFDGYAVHSPIPVPAAFAQVHAYFQDQARALLGRFVRHLVVAAPGGLAALGQRPVLYLANHQTGIESLLFMLLMQWLHGNPVKALAKNEHRKSFFGTIWKLGGRVGLPVDLLLFDRDRPDSLKALLAGFDPAATQGSYSLLIHVEGTRALQAHAPVSRISAVVTDLAVARDAAIVPVNFCGGLPLVSHGDKLEFPYEFGQQDYVVGAPIAAAELRHMTLKERGERVTAAINELAQGIAPGPIGCGDPGYKALVRQRMLAYRLSMHAAVFTLELERLEHKSRASELVLASVREGAPVAGCEDPALRMLLAELFGIHS